MKNSKKAGLIIFLLIFLSGIFVFKIFYKKDTTSKSITQFYAYGKNFRGKINLACVKIGKENKIIAAPQDGSILSIKVFNKNGKQAEQILAPIKGEIFNVAVGDVAGDKKDEIVLGQAGNNSGIYIYQQKKEKFELLDFFKAFGEVPIGVNIALGDVNGDQKKEIIVGAGEGGGPQIKIFNASGREFGSFFAFHPKTRTGVKVAALDYDNDKKDETVALANVLTETEYSTQFKVYKVDKLFSLENTSRVYDKETKIPANLLAVDVNNDGKKEIVVVPQKKLGQEIKIFGYGKEIKDSFLFNFIGQKWGGNLAICDLDNNGKNEVITNDGNSSLIKIYYQ